MTMKTTTYPLDVFGFNAPAGAPQFLGYEPSGDPFVPNVSSGYKFRKEPLREVLAFLTEPSGDALYLTGATGTGKTSLITEVAGRLNWPVQQITAHGRMELTDLIGYMALVAENAGDTPVMKFNHGVLAKAMLHGHILLINEVDLADPAELAGLNDILEGRPLVITQNGGEIIKPHPMFRVVVTGNSVGTGDTTGLYQGVVQQNLAALDRYRFTRVDYPDEEVELEILASNTSVPSVIAEGMVKVANEIRRLFVGDSNTGQMLSVTMSTRTLLRWARLSVKFRGAPNALHYALDQALLIRTEPGESEAILRIAKDVFGDQWR